MGLNYTSCKSIYQDFRKYKTIRRKNCILEDVIKANKQELDVKLAAIDYDEKVCNSLKMNLFDQLVAKQSD